MRQYMWKWLTAFVMLSPVSVSTHLSMSGETCRTNLSCLFELSWPYNATGNLRTHSLIKVIRIESKKGLSLKYLRLIFGVSDPNLCGPLGLRPTRTPFATTNFWVNRNLATMFKEYLLLWRHDPSAHKHFWKLVSYYNFKISIETCFLLEVF